MRRQRREDATMKKIATLLAVLAVLSLAGTASALTDKEKLVQFYESYLALVSSADYVATSRDTETWEAKFDTIAKEAGFEDAAAAAAAGEAMSASDSDIASLRQAVAEKIVQQYKPYME
jgi:hypothetical protein